MRGRVIDRIATSYRKAQATQVGHREDMHLADFRPITRHTAQLLVGYDPHVGAPTTADIKTLVAKFSPDVSAMIKTATLYPQYGALSVVAFKQGDTLKLDASKKMHEMIPDTQYVDMRTAEVWNVEEIEGEKVLVRQAEDDIATILKARKNMVKTSSVTFSEIRTAGMRHMDTGDMVEFVHKEDVCKGTVHRIVRNAQGDRVLVERDNEIHDIPIDAITNVTVMAEGIEAEKDELYNYYRTIYGEDYAKKLVYMDEA